MSWGIAVLLFVGIVLAWIFYELLTLDRKLKGQGTLRLNLRDVRLYWGDSEDPCVMRFHTSTALQKPHASPRMEQKHYTTREVLGFYGLLVGNCFIGCTKLGRSGHEQSGWSESKIQYRDAEDPES